MTISIEQLRANAEATGFRPEILEKVIHLLSLLEGFRSHPFLKSRLALKGGTALNLFVLDLPRLSVDIDLNYIGAAGRDAMLEERPQVEDAVRAVCTREGFSIQHQPKEHAGGKWLLRYDSAFGQKGNLEVDLNFMYRLPLWPVVDRDSKIIGSYQASRIPILDIHELAAGKLAALLSRRASRDLFDAHQILTRCEFDEARLRTAFVLYGAMDTARDWRTVSVDDIDFEPRELKNKLLPTLPNRYAAGIGSPDTWAKHLIDECRNALGAVLPLSETEHEFLDRLFHDQQITPSLLTTDETLAETIKHHPALLWRMRRQRV